MGQQVVGQQDRLGPLQVGVARQVGVPGLARPVQQHLLEGDDAPGHLAQERLVNRRRSVATWSFRLRPVCKPGPDVAGDLGDPPFDGGVDVLVAGFEDEACPRRAPPRHG